MRRTGGTYVNIRSDRGGVAKIQRCNRRPDHAGVRALNGVAVKLQQKVINEAMEVLGVVDITIKQRGIS